MTDFNSDVVDTWIIGYGCNSSAGDSYKDFWRRLTAGTDNSSEFPTHDWQVRPSFRPRAYRWTMRDTHDSPHVSARAILLRNLLQAWTEAKSCLEKSAADRIENSSVRQTKVGVILASTKGF